MKKFFLCLFALISMLAGFFGSFFLVRAKYPLAYTDIARAAGLDPHLVCAVIKAESGFRADSVSRAGAVGMMQLLPSTAEFVCEREDIEFSALRLSEAEYNVTLGCLYLSYLFDKFGNAEVTLAAYNAGEGVVRGWLGDPALSDGTSLREIPYPETVQYVKKVGKFKKMYDFFY